MNMLGGSQNDVPVVAPDHWLARAKRQIKSVRTRAFWGVDLPATQAAAPAAAEQETPHDISGLVALRNRRANRG